jgi:hypothetical protein
MREFRTYGSVRGVRGNLHPYRDRSSDWRRFARMWTWMAPLVFRSLTVAARFLFSAGR